MRPVPTPLGPLVGLSLGVILAWLSRSNSEAATPRGWPRKETLVFLFSRPRLPRPSRLLPSSSPAIGRSRTSSIAAHPLGGPLLVLVADALSVLVGFAIGRRLARRRALRAASAVAGAPLVPALLFVLIFQARLSIEGTFHQVQSDFGTEPVAGGPLGYALLWMSTLLAAGFAFTVRSLRIHRRANIAPDEPDQRARRRPQKNAGLTRPPRSSTLGPMASDARDGPGDREPQKPRGDVVARARARAAPTSPRRSPDRLGAPAKVRLGEPELVEEAGHRGLGMRVIKGGRVALTSTSDLTAARHRPLRRRTRSSSSSSRRKIRSPARPIRRSSRRAPSRISISTIPTAARSPPRRRSSSPKRGEQGGARRRSAHHEQRRRDVLAHRRRLRARALERLPRRLRGLVRVARRLARRRRRGRQEAPRLPLDGEALSSTSSTPPRRSATRPRAARCASSARARSRRARPPSSSIPTRRARSSALLAGLHHGQLDLAQVELPRRPRGHPRRERSRHHRRRSAHPARARLAPVRRRGRCVAPERRRRARAS